MLRDKISALRAKLSFGNNRRDQKIEDLSQRVDHLIDVVAKLAHQQAAETTAKPAATKPAATKPAVAKPAVAKPAVAKPAVISASNSKVDDND